MKVVRPSIRFDVYQKVQIGAALKGISPTKWLIEAILEKDAKEKLHIRVAEDHYVVFDL